MLSCHLAQCSGRQALAFIIDCLASGFVTRCPSPVLQAEEAEKELKPLMDFVKSTLGEKVERVEVSRRLSDSPVALVTSKFGWTANMERIMKSQVRAHFHTVDKEIDKESISGSHLQVGWTANMERIMKSQVRASSFAHHPLMIGNLLASHRLVE